MKAAARKSSGKPSLAKAAGPQGAVTAGSTRDRFQQELLEFVNNEVLAEESKKKKILPTTPLFEGGLINSLKILDLIAFVEKHLKTKIPDAQILMKNFRTVETIAHTFARR
jgi:acyl carrier protein